METIEPNFAGPRNDVESIYEKVLRVHHLLCEEYHCPIAYFHHLDPLSELLSSLLSHRTTNRNSGTAFKALKARYASWEELRDAPVEEVVATIPSVTWPEQKGPRLQAVLKEITNRREGKLSLDFLADWSEDQAQEWLESIPGIGPKTSAAVLLFSRLRKPALPVDSHHHRVAMRLGWISPKTGPGPAHALLRKLLPKDWEAQQLYDHHEVMMFHGQKVCFFKNPACQRCVVLGDCPTGQALLQKTPSSRQSADIFSQESDP